MRARLDPEKLLRQPVLQELVDRLSFFDARGLLRATVVQAALPPWKRREILKHVDASLSAVFPSMGHAARRRCVRAFERGWTNKIAEDVIVLSMSGSNRYIELFEEHVTFQGLENLDRALAAKKGVLCVGSHVGSITLATTSLHYALLRYKADTRPALRICSEPDVVRFPRVLTNLTRAAGQFGIDSKFVLTDRPRELVAKDMVEALQAKSILTTNLDVMRGGRSDFQRTMFGRASVRLPALAGAAKVALRTGATVLPWMNARRPEGFVVRFEAPIEVEALASPGEIGSGHEGFAALTERLADILEGWIISFKDQWIYWDRFHKRAQPIHRQGGPS